MTARAEVLAAELAEHGDIGIRRGPANRQGVVHNERHCACGEALPWTDTPTFHRAHVAAALDAALAQEGDQGDAVRAVAAVEALCDEADREAAIWSEHDIRMARIVGVDRIRAALADTTGALAKHDAVKAAALREAADAMDEDRALYRIIEGHVLSHHVGAADDIQDAVIHWLRDRIEAEAAGR